MKSALDTFDKKTNSFGMGVYYRKRIPIGKLFHINLSKNGAGLSFGKKGASISTGRRGTFFNWSIPGTGIYGRKKISGPSAQNNQPPKGNKQFECNLDMRLLVILAVVNLILGVACNNTFAFILAGVFILLCIIIFFSQRKREPATPQPQQSGQNSNPSDSVAAGGALLTKDMVNKLPANEANYLRSRKPMVNDIIKELRTNGSLCVPAFVQDKGLDNDTVDAILYLLGKMDIVTLTCNSPKTWSVS